MIFGKVGSLSFAFTLMEAALPALDQDQRAMVYASFQKSPRMANPDTLLRLSA